MSETSQESQRGEQWLTQGRPRAIRTRGAARGRGAVAPAPGAIITRIAEPTELLEWLKEDVPIVPWVVVVDGRVGLFAQQVCLQAKSMRESSIFWVVDSGPEMPAGSAFAALAPLRLHPQEARDMQFRDNLVADLVIVSAEPKASQSERIRRWLSQARYILAEDPAVSSLEALRMAEPAGGSRAEIYIIQGKE